MYKYKVIKNNEESLLEADLNCCAEEGWRVISVAWDYDKSMLVAVLENKE